MSPKINRPWFRTMTIRLVTTLFQCLIGGGIASFIYDFPPIYILYIVGNVCVLSIVTSIFSLPEARTDGTLQIDTKDVTKDVYRLNLDGDLSLLPKKKIVILSVDPNADLSQK